jgi:tRNA modification GTPase
MYVQDTIAAISTPVGEGGIGVIRTSGAQSLPIAQTIFRRNRDGGLNSHRFYYGTIVDPVTSDCLDEAMVVFMRCPHSYTREDVLEIQCHGGSLIVQRILSLVLQQGARLAEPGEFTKRAFLNGRIDLVQAEAVIDVIRSKTETSLALAQHQREGLLSQRISQAKEGIVSALAVVEAFIDFPEEDLDISANQQIHLHLERSLAEVDALVAGFSEGRVLRDGVSVVIAGKPNVGKSSLLNTLLRERRAIVTSVPGTTRDIIEEVVTIKGLPIRLLDTAGIRESHDQIEQEGVRLTLEKIPSADLVLFVVDTSRPFTAEDQIILNALAKSTVIVVKNKSDLSPSADMPAFLHDRAVAVSTRTGDGIETLRNAIHDMFIHGHAVDSREYVAISQARHRDALEKCQVALSRFQANLGDCVELELLALDLRDALAAVGEITGETTADDVLDHIFQRFCIGK